MNVRGPDRIDNAIFFDRHIQGITRVQVPGEMEAVGSERLRADHFFRRPGPPPRDPLRHFAADPWKLAGIMAGAGFLAVFVDQAPFLFQLVLGAPIFEELLKFGIALLLAYPLRFRLLRVPVALAVGAGFGWLEHALTYAAEGDRSFMWRVLFHALSTGLSMAVWQGLERMGDVRVRWGAPLGAIFLHYVNNAMAIPLALLGLATTETLPLAFSIGVVGVLGAAFLWGLVHPSGPARMSARTLYRFTQMEPPSRLGPGSPAPAP